MSTRSERGGKTSNILRRAEREEGKLFEEIDRSRRPSGNKLEKVIGEGSTSGPGKITVLDSKQIKKMMRGNRRVHGKGRIPFNELIKQPVNRVKPTNRDDLESNQLGEIEEHLVRETVNYKKHKDTHHSHGTARQPADKGTKSKFNRKKSREFKENLGQNENNYWQNIASQEGRDY